MSKNKHNEKAGSLIKRTDERIAETQEVFTPMELVTQMVDSIPQHTIECADSTFLDNSAGCGNFLIALKARLVKYHTEEWVLNNMLYAIEFMEDNHKELCDNLGVPYDHPHYICGDGLDNRIYTRWDNEKNSNKQDNEPLGCVDGQLVW